MNADGPKVLVEVGGRAILSRLLEAVTAICERPTIVVGYEGEKVIEATGGKFHYVWQREQLGTGHAVACARESLAREPIKNIIVLPGDHPMVSASTLSDLLRTHEQGGAVLTMTSGEADSYEGDYAAFYNFGRIKRNNAGEVERIVELKDASEEEKNISEVNFGYYCFKPDWLWQNIDQLKDDNKAKEYYLTDLVKLAVDRGEKIGVFTADNIAEGFGVNTPEQLAIVEKYLS